MANNQMRNDRKASRVWLKSAFLVASASHPALGWAQGMEYAPTPPIRSVVDENGVDRATGLFQTRDAALSIGPQDDGLSFTRYGLSRLGNHNFDLRALVSGSKVTIVSGASGQTFTSSGGLYTSDNGDGSTLAVSASAVTLTGSDGTVTTFDRYLGTGQGANPEYAYATDILYPNNRKVKLTYQVFVRNKRGDPIPVTFVRLLSVNSGNYQLKFVYSQQTGTPNVTWLTFSSVTAINNSVEACDPTAPSCSLTGSWPSVSFSSSGPNSTVTDETGRQLTYAFDDNNRLSSIKYPGSSQTDIQITYGSDGRVSSVTNKGVVTTYSWSSAAGKLTSTSTRSDGSRVTIADQALRLLLSDRDETNNTRRYFYNSFGLLTYAVDPEGTVTGNTPTSGYTKFTYDSRGNQTEIRKVGKSGSNIPDIVTTFNFDPVCSAAAKCNKPNSITDPRGAVTNFSYDPAHGGLTVSTGPVRQDGLRPEVRIGYTQLGLDGLASNAGTWKPTSLASCMAGSTCGGAATERKVSIGYGNGLVRQSITVAAGDGSISSTKSMDYNEVGNVTSVSDESMAQTKIYYNAARQVIGVNSPDPDGSGPLRSRRVNYRYDAAGRLDQVQVGSANADGSGFSSLQQTSIGYDAYGRKTSEQVTASGTTYGVTQYSYDSLGRVQCTAVRMDPAQWDGQSDACVAQTSGANGPDRVSKVDYDEVGRVRNSYSALGTADQTVESQTYTPNGQVASVTDGNGNVTSYGYDGFDRLKTTTYPGGSYEELTLDANGNVTTKRMRDGKLVNYGYDALNQLTSIDRSYSTTYEPNKTFEYDLVGNLTKASDSYGHALTYGYDALGRRTSQGDNWYFMGRATYQYDAAGRRTRVTWGDNNYVSYDYRVTGEMSTIRDSAGNALVTFGYDDLGRRTSLARANGTVTTYGYDPASRLSQLVQNLAGTAQDQTLSFGYNPAGQIVSRTGSNDAYAWTGHYNVDRSYGVNALNQLTSAGSTALGYDGRGNLTSSGSSSYAYTADNQMKNVGGVGSLTYDPFGRLLNGAIDGAAETRFLYDGPDLIAEQTSNSTTLRRYVYGPGTDEPLIWYEGGSLSNRRWLHADERGSVIAVTNDAGTAIAINRYDDFGIPQSGNTGRFQYTGQKWLPNIGLYDYKARMYSPTLGRFMQTDPIGYADGLNWYNYVGGDPVNNTDPSGMCGAVADLGPEGEIIVQFCPNYGGGGGFFSNGGSNVSDRESYCNGGNVAADFLAECPAVPGSGVPPIIKPIVAQPQMNPICPRNGFTDALGKLRALPATAAGLITGYAAGVAQELAGGPAVHVGVGNNAIQFTGLTGGDPVGFTLGNVQLYGASTGPRGLRGRYDGGAASGNMGSHEEGHTYQFQGYSLAYMAYQFAASKLGNSRTNAMENEADNYADRGPRCQ